MQDLRNTSMVRKVRELGLALLLSCTPLYAQSTDSAEPSMQTTHPLVMYKPLRSPLESLFVALDEVKQRGGDTTKLSPLAEQLLSEYHSLVEDVYAPRDEVVSTPERQQDTTKWLNEQNNFAPASVDEILYRDSAESAPAPGIEAWPSGVSRYRWTP